MTGRRSGVSALVLTLNEANDIERCLASLTWCEEVVVLDSYSNDGTAEIAENIGARVERRAFDDYASQRNFGLKAIEYDTEWILMVDADETVPEGLAQEIIGFVHEAPQDVALGRIARVEHFLDGTLDHCMGGIWYGRLVRKDKVEVTRKINEEYHAQGAVRHLENKLHHFPFSKGSAAWFEKHNRYSTMEAQEKAKRFNLPLKSGELLKSDPVKRRAALKRLAYRLPFRPLLTFFYMYVIKRGFLDGRAGYHYCRLRMVYEYMIDTKVLELRHGAFDDDTRSSS